MDVPRPTAPAGRGSRGNPRAARESPDNLSARGARDTGALAELASDQHGVLGRDQLLGLGVSDSAISRWTLTGRLHRVLPGVYALGHRNLSIDGRLRAALLYAGDRAVLSHTTAAWLWSLTESEPRVIHVSIPRKRRSLGSVRIHRAVREAAIKRSGFPITTVADTLLDLASVVTDRQLRRYVAEAEYRDLLDIAAIEEAMGPGRRGSTRLRRALQEYTPSLARTRSELEERFLELCASAGLPTPEVNVRVDRFLVDALWRDYGLIVELDGATAHKSWSAIRRDRRRELELRRAGYVVVRYTWEQIAERATEVVADLRRLLSGAIGSAPHRFR